MATRQVSYSSWRVFQSEEWTRTSLVSWTKDGEISRILIHLQSEIPENIINSHISFYFSEGQSTTRSTTIFGKIGKIGKNRATVPDFSVRPYSPRAPAVLRALRALFLSRCIFFFFTKKSQIIDREYRNLSLKNFCCQKYPPFQKSKFLCTT